MDNFKKKLDLILVILDIIAHHFENNSKTRKCRWRKGTDFIYGFIIK